jgi:hypothetical protein
MCVGGERYNLEDRVSYSPCESLKPKRDTLKLLPMYRRSGQVARPPLSHGL